MQELEHAIALYHKGDFKKALKQFEIATSINPTNPEPYRYRAIIQAGLGNYFEAKELIEFSISLDPRFGGSYVTLGAIHGALGDEHSAGDCYKKALQLSPGCPTALWNLSLYQLKHGNWEEGWKNYEVRKIQSPLGKFRALLPHLKEYGTDSRVLIHAEQGLGDFILFSRFLRHLKARGQREIILECPSALVSLYQDFPYVDKVYACAMDMALPTEVDCVCSIADLPTLLGLKQSQVNGAAYLSGDKKMSKAIRGALPEGFNIGICWAGSPTHVNDMNRSAHVHDFAPLFEIPGVNIVSLQKDLRNCEFLQKYPILKVEHAFADVKSTATVIGALDLVVSIDSLVANLCGAIGAPCSLLLSQSSDWRWGIDGKSVFYNSVQPYRQKHRKVWTEPMEEVVKDVKARMGL